MLHVHPIPQSFHIIKASILIVDTGCLLQSVHKVELSWDKRTKRREDEKRYEQTRCRGGDGNKCKAKKTSRNEKAETYHIGSGEYRYFMQKRRVGAFM